MSVENVKYNFAAGEISPSMVGRSDLELYDVAVRGAVNFFVDPRGGISNRAGTFKCDWLFGVAAHRTTISAPQFVTYAFNSDPNYAISTLILINHQLVAAVSTPVIRFMRDGKYQTVAMPFTVLSFTQGATTTVVFNGAHGLSSYDILRISAVVGSQLSPFLAGTWAIEIVNATTIRLRWPNNENVDSSAWPAITSATFFKVYTFAVTAWQGLDIRALRFNQVRDVIYITHGAGGAVPKRLIYIDSTTWSLVDESYGAIIAAPTNLVITPSGAGTAGVAFLVTSVDKFGNESPQSAYAFNAVTVNYAVTAGSVRLTWTAVASAKYYKVYRTNIIAIGANLTRAEEVGFVGYAYGPSFEDNNIIADFTLAPPVYYNPFADGAVEYIDVNAGGAGYTKAAVVSLSIGTGFIGYPIVSPAGVLLAIAVIAGGQNYTAASVVTVTVGAGATFSISVSGTQNDPFASCIFQQRMVYGGTLELPMTLFGSLPRQFAAFDTSLTITESDAYQFDLDASDVAPILFMNATRFGLLIWTTAGLWQVSGGNEAVSPLNVFAEPQTFKGIDFYLPPLTIGPDFIYMESTQNRIRYLQYTADTKVYGGIDLTAISNNLISSENSLVSWTLAPDPFNIIYSAKKDGTGLMLTLQEEAKLFGWAHFETSGRIHNYCTVHESVYLSTIAGSTTITDGTEDVVYMLVERDLGARGKIVMIECLSSRKLHTQEDAMFLDGAVSTIKNLVPNAGNIPTVVDPGLTFVPVASDSIVVPANYHYRVYDGKYVLSGANVMNLLPQTHGLVPKITDITTKTMFGYEWSGAQYPFITSLGGMVLYAGMTVKVVADGKVLPDQIVSSTGYITVADNPSMVHVGFPYRSYVHTLPVTVEGANIRGRLKKATKINVRMQDTRGLTVGPDLAHLKPVREEVPVLMGESVPLQTTVKAIIVDGAYDMEGSFYFVQDYPMPCTILGYTASLELGDADSE